MLSETIALWMFEEGKKQSTDDNYVLSMEEVVEKFNLSIDSVRSLQVSVLQELNKCEGVAICSYDEEDESFYVTFWIGD